MYKYLEKYTYMVLPFLPSASTVTVKGIAILCVIFASGNSFFKLVSYIMRLHIHQPLAGQVFTIISLGAAAIFKISLLLSLTCY